MEDECIGFSTLSSLVHDDTGLQSRAAMLGVKLTQQRSSVCGSLW